MQDCKEPPDLPASVARARELRERAVASARRAIAAHGAVRSLCQSSAQVREAARLAMERSAELQAAAAKLRNDVTAYAHALHALGETVAHAIEDARYIADEALRLGPGASLNRTERDGLARDLVVWTVDAYAA